MKLAEVKTATKGRLVKELSRLSDLLNRYGHCWCEEPSDRLQRWVDVFERIREDRRDAYEQWMAENGYLGDGYGDRTAYDAMA